VVSARELAQAFETSFAKNLAATRATLDEALAFVPGRWVDLVVATFRDLGRAQSLEVAPLRRGVGELGWELVWGRNLVVGAERLARTDPAELFELTLVLEASEGSLRAGSLPERAMEEVANDLAKLTWARAPLKVLVFGARRDADVPNALDGLASGISLVVAARDRDSDYLLVGFPNLEGARHVAPARASLWLETISRGQVEPAREVLLGELLRD
jgi:hypothetical protein